MNTPIPPLISIVTVCYNAVRDLEPTIQSVLNQTYPNIEYIIIDGGSTDGTINIIHKYQKRLTYWISEPDKGIYDAMNKGIKHAQGEWISFMNAGDLFYNNQVITNVFNNSIPQNIKVIYGDHIKKNGYYKKIIHSRSTNCFYKQLPFCHQSAFLKNDGYTYDINYRIAADYDLFRSIYAQNGPSSYKKLKLIISIFDATGISTTNEQLLRKEYSAIYRKYKDYYFYYDYIKEHLKRIFST